MWEVLPVLFTFLFAHFRISASLISFPWEWDLKFFNSWSIVNLINCHNKAEKIEQINLDYEDQVSFQYKQCNAKQNTHFLAVRVCHINRKLKQTGGKWGHRKLTTKLSP